MLNIAYSMDSHSLLESALLNRKNYNPEITKEVSVMGNDVQSDSDYYVENGTVKELYDFVNEDENVDESFEYARYWNGYLIILKPLLLVMNYNQIRYCVFAIIFILVLILSILIYKKFNVWYALSFCFSILITDILISALCLNTAVCVLISLIASIYILIKDGKIKNVNILFFVIGILTNLLDLLTNPIITLGLPLITYFMIAEKKNKNIKNFILLSFNWAVGYIVFWVTKWIITDMLFDKNIITNAVYQVVYRTSGLNVLMKNLINRLMYFLGKFSFFIILLLVGICIYIFFDNLKNKKNFEYAVYLLIPLMVICWFIVLKNHSAIHAFFTYRNIFIIIYGMLIYICENTNIIIKKE